eukprot:CAMPEP_0172414402 /NCGR_PEP_ID=MMETSP1064-20121228/1064_1 /TAXON_ID=202472 /ORGANISM="Aulacoseira subarctica , Strain CCAP 1002/5" /LENGTH=266 /DNA_ID=CAMNT_0013151055 /DNA_START=49 /DNA_END=847 /DNA_ORIENTATION=-
MKTSPLHYSFVFWYMRRGKGAGGSEAPLPKKDGENAKEVEPAAESHDAPPHETTATGSSANNVANPYESSIKEIATVSTVEEFWTVYDWLNRPNDLPNTTDFHFFRKGIKPTWEDPENVKGGKWLIRLKKGLASRYWEEILLAMVGQQFHGVPAEEINGAVVSIRYAEDIISIWNRTAFDREITEKIRDGIKKILRLPGHVHMEYKPHQASLQDKSSFRNTTVWKPKSERTPAAPQGDDETPGAQTHGGNEKSLNEGISSVLGVNK